MIILPKREKIATHPPFTQELLQALDAFYRIVSAAHWQNSFAVQETFPTANILINNRVIFDINNQYHLGVKINYPMQAMRVLFFEPYGKLPQILSDNL